MDDELIGVSECARRRGLSRAAIHHAIARGEIPARRIGNSYAIRGCDCEAYAPTSAAARSRAGVEAKRAKRASTVEREDSVD